MTLDPGGIIVPIDANDKVAVTKALPATRSISGITSDASITFENMAPEEIILEVVQPTLTPTLSEPAVLFPIVKPDMEILTYDEDEIAAPETVQTKETTVVGLHTKVKLARLLEPTAV